MRCGELALSSRQRFIKRFLDILISMTVLILLTPLFTLLGIAIKLDSAGPILFRQVRIGLLGKEFKVFKFRSMIVDAEHIQEELETESIYTDPYLFKVPNDPRTTKFGKFLRKTSIDEFPQFLNVLWGDMSVVGPRPPLPSEVNHYQEHHFCRFNVKPGITGPWQVSGRNNITDFGDVLQLEFDYIYNWSLWRDIKIIFRTLPAMISGKGAY